MTQHSVRAVIDHIKVYSCPFSCNCFKGRRVLPECHVNAGMIRWIFLFQSIFFSDRMLVNTDIGKYRYWIGDRKSDSVYRCVFISAVSYFCNRQAGSIWKTSNGIGLLRGNDIRFHCDIHNSNAAAGGDGFSEAWILCYEMGRPWNFNGYDDCGDRDSSKKAVSGSVDSYAERRQPHPKRCRIQGADDRFWSGNVFISDECSIN